MKIRSIRRPRFLATLSTFSMLSFLLPIISCQEELEKIPPIIETFTPSSGQAGDVVTITGLNFGTSAAKNTVKLNGIHAVITSATKTEIVITVPATATTGPISVTVNEMTATTESDFVVLHSPEIISITPMHGLPGTIVTIIGKNFGEAVEGNTVKFGALAVTINEASTNTLKVVVPEHAISGFISVTADGFTTQSEERFIVPPVLLSFSPGSGLTGSEVTVTGTGFSEEIEENKVRIGDVIAEVLSATATSVTVLVPAAATTGAMSIEVDGHVSTAENSYTVLPDIESISPVIGPVGTTVTIQGSGFSTTPANNIVTFNGETAEVTSATANTLKVVVPANATTGEVRVTSGGNEAIGPVFEMFVEAVTAGGTEYDAGAGVAVDASGNSYIVGHFQGTATFGTTELVSAGGTDVFIAKYNSNAELIWAKKAGGSGSDEGSAIALDGNGNIYITGSFSSSNAVFGSLNASAAGYDIFIAKYNNDGAALWLQQIGGSSTDHAGDIVVDPTNNVLVTGAFQNSVTVGTETLTSEGGTDVVVAKYASGTGAPLWARKFGGADDESASGIGANATSIFITGAFFGSAQFEGTMVNSGGALDGFVARLSNSGSLIWVKAMGGTDWDAARGVAINSDGDCLVTGYFTTAANFGSTSLSGAGMEDIFVAKYAAANGDAIWAKKFGSTDYDYGKALALDNSGNIYVTGYYSRSASFGSVSLSSKQNSRDIFAARLDSQGNVLWAKSAGGNETDSGNAIFVGNTGRVYVTGYFRTHPGTFGITTRQSYGNDDMFLWRILN